MRRLCMILVAALLALVAGAGSGATGVAASTGHGDDRLHAPDCRSALASLQAHEVAADAAARASDASGARGRAAPGQALLAARRLAANSCLASRADPAPPPRSIQAPIVVAPVAPTTAAPPVRARGLPPVSRPAERPFAVTACDPGGCWADDGSRLNRIGPNLWGKRGVCTLQGSLLVCP